MTENEKQEVKYYVQIDESKKPTKVIGTTINPQEYEGKSDYVEVVHQDYINSVGWLLQKRNVVFKDGKPEVKEDKPETSNKKKD